MIAAKSIFISHSHEDNEWCRPVVAALKAVGYDVWYDEIGLQGGAEWIHTLEHEIETRDILLVVLSPEAMASDWVRREIDLALATHRQVIPVMYKAVPPEGFLRLIQWVNAIEQDARTAARAIIIGIESTSPHTTPIIPLESLEDLVATGRALVMEQRYSDALSTANRAIAIDEHCFEAWATKIATLLRIGQRKEAYHTFEQAVTANASTRSEGIHAYREILGPVGAMTGTFKVRANGQFDRAPDRGFTKVMSRLFPRTPRPWEVQDDQSDD